MFITDPDPGSGSLFFIHPGSRITDPEVKKAPDPGSATLLASCVTSEFLTGVAVGGHGILASCVTSEYLAGVAVGCWYPGQLRYF
jgi:hypothetical protein